MINIHIYIYIYERMYACIFGKYERLHLHILSSSSSSSSSYRILLLHLIPAGFSSSGSVVYNAYPLP